MGTGAGIAATIAGTGISVASQMRSKASAKAIAKHNRDLAFRKASAVRAANLEEQLQARHEAARTTSENIAATAAGGVQLSGSPLLETMNIADRAASNIAIMGFNAEQQARDIEAAGEMGVFEADQFAKSTNLAIAGTLIGGVSDVIAMNKPKSKGLVSKEAKALPTNKKLMFGNRKAGN